MFWIGDVPCRRPLRRRQVRFQPVNQFAVAVCQSIQDRRSRGRIDGTEQIINGLDAGVSFFFTAELGRQSRFQPPLNFTHDFVGKIIQVAKSSKYVEL